MQTSLSTLSFHEEILQFLPDAIIWAKPVKDEANHVIDFEVQYANQKADDLINHQQGHLKGLRIKRDGIPHPLTSEENFRSFLNVYLTGNHEEYSFFAVNTGTRVETEQRKFRDGILSTTRDRKAQREAERNEREKGILLDGIIENAPLGILIYETERDESGNISDFRIKTYNHAVHELTGFSEKERSQLTLKELLHSLDAPGVIDRYINTVETGESFAFDFYSPRVHRWLHMSVVKLGDGFLILQSDITEVKNIQQALQQKSEYLNSVLNASLNGIYVLDAVRDSEGYVTDFIFSTCNQRYAELTGWSTELVIGQSLLTLFPQTLNGAFRMFCQVIERNEPHRQEMYYSQTLNRWYDYIAVKLGSNSIVVTFQEITKERESAIQIEQQKALLDNMLKHAPSGVVVFKAIREEGGNIQDLKCIIVNDAVEQLTQIPRKEILQNHLSNIVPDIDASLIFRNAVSTLETGTSIRFQHFHTPVQKWLKLSLAGMDEDHLIMVVTDITEIKEIQLQLESLVEELKRSNADLEDFAHVASHDLQEPLRKIRTFSDRLKRELGTQLPDEYKFMFDRMESAAMRMKNLITDLLAYSQVSKNPGELEPVDLNEIIQNVLQDLEAPIHETGATVNVEHLPSIPGNDRQLRQMFQNLIGNALKYRKPELKPEVEIRCRPIRESDPLSQTLPSNIKKGCYLIEVIDNGIGFEQEHAQKIFKVFQRLHGRSEYEGTGVGLAIVQKVVNNHKGYITAQSEPGQGATFQVFLPG